VFGAPLPQVEDGLERRTLPAGHVFHVGGVQHTLGAPIGNPGSTATVHHVQGQPGMVAKVFHGGAPRDQAQEAHNLGKVHEFHGSTDSADHHIILATKHTGNTLDHTQAWHNADAAGKENLKKQAASLVVAKNMQHAVNNGIIHTDTNHGNVLYHESGGGLTSAHLIDWGLARPSVVKNDGSLDKDSQRHVDRSGRVATHGL